MPNLILASLSPRRYELLSRLHIPFVVESENIEEILDESLSLEDTLKSLSYQKALPVFSRFPESIVMGADTIVYFNHQILGKPKNLSDAKQMLLSFSNQKQSVYTAVTMMNKDKCIRFVEMSEVYFKELDEEIVEDYLKTNEWVDKAGGYAIQGFGKCLIDHYVGDYDNIVGLPVNKVKEVLMNEFDYKM